VEEARGSPERATPLSEVLAGESDRGASFEDLRDRRLVRYARAKRRSLEMVAHIESIIKPSDDLSGGIVPFEDPILGIRGFLSPSVLAALRQCGDYLRWHYYYQRDIARLAGANFCKCHLLCPLCAIRRGARLLRCSLEKWDITLSENPSFELWLVTLTVKNGFDLQERFEHLAESYSKLVELRKKQRQRKSVHCEFGKIEGALTSFETTWSDIHGYHPHAHMICAVNKGVFINEGILASEWHGVTGDSFVVNARPVYGDPIEAFCEVTKYAVKTSDMTVQRNFDVYTKLRGRNLFRSFGCFYGIQIPEDYNDINEMSKDEPYIELIARYFCGVGYQFTEIRKDVVQQKCECVTDRQQQVIDRDKMLERYSLWD